jgi:1-pyrroline-2-carboxylate reductase [NAD(P)H]
LILIPIAEGVFSEEQIIAELSEMHQFDKLRAKTDITLFKSVGTALSDLITAHLVYKSLL